MNRTAFDAFSAGEADTYAAALANSGVTNNTVGYTPYAGATTNQAMDKTEVTQADINAALVKATICFQNTPNFML